MPNLTLRDIAKALNLSVSTVSKALHDSYEIGEDTKKRVMDFAQENHYQPNRMAKSLKEGKSGSIGVVICSIDNNFVSQMLDGIDLACTTAQYDLIIMQSKESFSKEKACVAQLEARGVEGLLISPSVETNDVWHLQALQRAGIPVVLFDRLSDHMHTHQIGTDNFGGAYEATKHLIDNGHSHIAFLNVDTTLNIASERLAGYRQAIKERKLAQPPDAYILSCNCSNKTAITDSVNEAIISLLQLAQPPTAILTATDQLSMQTLSTIHQLGLHIPDDIALVAFSNTDLAEILATPLTTIRQPAYEIGKTAAEKLIQLLRGKESTDDFQKIKLPMQLEIRKSSLPNKRHFVRL